jgi:hypothetical protein
LRFRTDWSTKLLSNERRTTHMSPKIEKKLEISIHGGKRFAKATATGVCVAIGIGYARGWGSTTIAKG